jgi:crotonobetainyl-CoA:carnitine CoA-transferase CaiB-like acyl-CoA transferase
MTENVTTLGSKGFLRGLKVLELGDGLAGAAATATLLTLGASVTTLVDSTSTFRRARPSYQRVDGTDASLLSLLLDEGKECLALNSITRDDLEAILRRASDGADNHMGYDLVVVDRVAGAPYELSGLATAAAYASWVTSLNTRAWVTISAFGLSGPRADDVATELTLGAVSSVLSVVRDPMSGQPLKLAGNQALLNSAQAAALASCHAIDLARGGEAVHLDFSAQEASISMGPVLAFAQQLLNCDSSVGAKRYGAPAGLYTCRDGSIHIMVMEDHQWQGVVRAMGSPSWTERFADSEARIEFATEIDDRIGDWTKDLLKQDLEGRLQTAGVPATAMYRPDEILESPQLAFRDSLKTSYVSEGVVVRSVGRPFPDAPPTQTNEGSSRHRSLDGLRVVEASHVLAVPLAGALLGAIGAQVTKLEDLDRIDMYRRRGPYIDGEEGIDRAAYFALVNHSKTSATVDLGGESADVVIENIGKRRVDRFGMTDAFEGRRPDKLVVSSSGFGNTGPHASYRAYAYNLHTSCGLGYLTRNEAGEHAVIDLAFADLASAYTLATIIAAWAVGPLGNVGMVVDFAMAELIDSRFNEFLAAASIDPASDETVDRANAVSPFAPSGVYRCTEGWIALSVDGDESFSRLCEALDLEPTVEKQFALSDRREADRLELDDHLASAFEKEDSKYWSAELRSRGIFAERVASVTDLISDAHLNDRGYFVAVDHPVWGRRRLLGMPWRPVGANAIELRHPPLLMPLQ